MVERTDGTGIPGKINQQHRASSELMNMYHGIFNASIQPATKKQRSRSLIVRQYLAFTLIELLVVIAIIAVLAGLLVGLAPYAVTKMRESRIRAELTQYVTTIVAYKAKFGQYPPDNVASQNPLLINSVSNSLYYELTGVIVASTRNGEVFHERNRQLNLSPGDVNAAFNRDGFLNQGVDPKEVKNFLPNLMAKQHKSIPIGQVNKSVELLTVPLDWPINGPTPPINSPVTDIQRINPWHYVSTQPTNNPDSFDLWAEYVSGGKVKIICNWSKDILEK